MPATLTPFGMRPVYHPSGIIRMSQYAIAAAYNTAIYYNAPVTLNTSGLVELAAAGNDEFILGSFAGVAYTEAAGRRVYRTFWPGAVSGATDIECYVNDDPEIVFAMQANATLDQTDVGEQGNVVNPGAGSTVTGYSTAAFAASTATAGNRQLAILGFARLPDNAAGDTYPILHVKIAQHRFRARPTGF